MDGDAPRDAPSLCGRFDARERLRRRMLSAAPQPLIGASGEPRNTSEIPVKVDSAPVAENKGCRRCIRVRSEAAAVYESQAMYLGATRPHDIGPSVGGSKLSIGIRTRWC